MYYDLTMNKTETNELRKVVDIIGSCAKVGAVCGVSGEAVKRWVKLGRLPYTEAIGKTKYAEKLSKFDRKISKKKLLDTVQIRIISK